jgi:hypothetical protein
LMRIHANHLGLRMAFMIRPLMRENIPMARQIKCYSRVRGTVRTAYPPNWTSAVCTPIVPKMMKRKRPLLKKPLNTLNSRAPNLRELISLKICMNTNEWKMIV